MKSVIDDCLSTRGGHLYMEGCDTTALVEQFGSPLFAISENQLRRNVKEFQHAFSKYWTDGPVDVLPANKANWNTAVRTVLTQEGAGADIYSEGELHAALICDVPRHLISVNGGGKSDAMLRRCIESGVRITVEDLDEPERINQIAKELNTCANIRFRVKPDFPNLWKKTDFAVESVSIDLGIQVYKSGIPAQYLEVLGKQVLAMEHVELTGFHFHGGRHHNSLWYWRGLMKRYGELISYLCKAWGGYQPTEIDIGGGFAAARDPFGKLDIRFEAVATMLTYPLEVALHSLGESKRYRVLSSAIEKFMTKLPSQKRAPSISDYAKATVTTLRATLRQGGIKTEGVRLQLEPGRSLYSDTGIHLTTVKKVKQQTLPMTYTWLLTDTTYFFMSGGALEYNAHDFRVANKVDEPAVTTADIVGHSCYADRIFPLAKVPRMTEGDVIAFLDMGAYQEVSASNFNALPRPAMVLVNNDRAEIIKVAETIEDVYQRDRIPEYLLTKQEKQADKESLEERV